jgi:hypothetical protein
MGLTLTETNDSTYYGSGGDHGAYQFLTLSEIVKTFLATYCGEGKICEKIRANDVYFHATRAMQEFSYDVFRSVKSQEITVPNTLTMKLPRDFVNHVKLSWSDNSGIKHVIYPAIVTSNPTDVGQDANDDYTFTADVLDTDEESTTWDNYKAATPNENQQDDYDDENYKHMADERYGIDPKHAQINGSYYIDYNVGNIHFASSLSGKTLILDYISDGLGHAADVNTTSYGNNALVHKFAEEAMYKHILYGCLSALAQPPAALSTIKKERWAETRKAKIRLSNIKIEELTQIMRGGSKWIKH